MRVVRVVAFSGFDSRVTEGARRLLQGSQVRVAHGPKSKEIDDNYFEKILLSTLFHVKNIKANDAIVDAILVSCLDSGSELRLEQRAFFPAFRRLQLPMELRRDVHAGARIAAAVIHAFKSEVSDRLRRSTRCGPCAVALLPCENVRLGRFRTELFNMYEMAMSDFSRRLERDVRRMRGGRGLKIGTLEFKGCENGPSHPIRRTSQKEHCDVAAMLRLGFSVPERFEFDICCDAGLEGKTFYHCDGRSERAPRGSTHVNMRINGDFQVK